ncbi:sugar porter family MFS transporter [Mycobacterium sp.]|uniref:sugar porter family MFS transporter n=1 Tax=Mycobacterium sp. TaxID=1785 RepID=UPI003BAB2A9E
MSRARTPLLIGLTAASLGVIFGYDLSSIAGALLFISKEFGLTTGEQELLTATAVIGQIAGALGGGVLANVIGRKKSMVLISASYVLFALLGAFAASIPVLLLARLLLGVAIGVSVVVVPVYVAESAPAAVRGSLLTAYQVATVSGIILGYVSGYLLAGSQSWRWMLGLAALPAALLLPLLLRLPDTARWYLLKDRVSDARQALLTVEPQTAVDAELAEIAKAINEDRASASSSFAEMLRQPYLRATLFAVALGFLIQITGINAIVYYSPRLFAALGFEGNFALLALPAMVQVAGLAAVFSSLVLVDKLGRRPILLSGIAMMIVADAILIAAFAHDRGGAAGHTSTLALIFGFAGVLLFIVGFNSGFGSLVWVYAGESFPSRMRAMGSSVMLTTNLIANAIVAGFSLTLLHLLGGAGIFAVFALFAVAAFGLVYRYAPETKGRQLEDIRHFWENAGQWPTAHTTLPEDQCP